jgi:hypothetical protein
VCKGDVKSWLRHATRVGCCVLTLFKLESYIVKIRCNVAASDGVVLGAEALGLVNIRSFDSFSISRVEVGGSTVNELNLCCYLLSYHLPRVSGVLFVRLPYLLHSIG